MQLYIVENCMIEIDGCVLSAKYVCTKNSTVLYPGLCNKPDYTKTFNTYIISFTQDGGPCHIQMETSTGGEYRDEKDKIVYEGGEIFRPCSVQINRRHMYIKEVILFGNKVIFRTEPIVN